MGRIVAAVAIENALHPEARLRCDAFVDTGAAHLVLPTAWRERLGELEEIARPRLETATQEIIEGVLCGPVKIQIEGFRPVFNEVLFIDMHPDDGEYEPLLGDLILEQSQIAVDRLGHRLVPVRAMDLK